MEEEEEETIVSVLTHCHSNREMCSVLYRIPAILWRRTRSDRYHAYSKMVFMNRLIQNMVERNDRIRNKDTGEKRTGEVSYCNQSSEVSSSTPPPLPPSHSHFCIQRPLPLVPSAFQSNFVLIPRMLTFFKRFSPPSNYTSSSLSVFGSSPPLFLFRHCISILLLPNQIPVHYQ